MQHLASRSPLSCKRAGLYVNHRVPTKFLSKADVVEARVIEPQATSSTFSAPEWLPEQAVPVLKFLNSKDFKATDVPQYNQYVKPYLENQYFVKSTGFKDLPEAINGRAAMLGFILAALGELAGAGPVLGQISNASPFVLIYLAAITAGSIVPIVKGSEGGYLESLKDTYSLPEGVFTESIERIHGRLAMIGTGTLVAIELVIGRALL